MRRIAKICPPTYVEKTVNITDFESVTKCAYNVKPTTNGLEIENFTTEKVFNLPPYQIEKLFFVNKTLFAYCQNGTVYAREKGEWAYKTTCESQPEIVRVNVNGEFKVAVITNAQAVLLQESENQPINIPKGNAYATFKYRLFVAKDNSLIFSAPIDNVNFNQSVNGAGELYVDSFYGKILALIPLKNRLVVVCEKTIYLVTITNGTNGFTLTKQDVDISVEKDSVCQVNDSVYFISQNQLYCYKISGLEMVKTKFSLSQFNLSGKVASMVSGVFLPLSNGNEKGVLFLDALTNEERFFNDYQKVIDNGYFVGKDGIYKIKVGQSNEESLWESLPLDFLSPYKKGLTRVSLQATGKVQMQILGQHTKRQLTFESSEIKKLNLSGYAFTVILSFNSGVKVKNLKFVYTIKE